MKRIVVFPSEAISDYLKVGQDYETISGYFNPANYFDEVYCLSPWGDKAEETIAGVKYIRANPLRFKSIIKDISPSVIRAYGGYRCADYAAISKVDGIPTVVSIHDTNKDLMFKTILNADAVICTADCVKQSLLEKLNYNKQIYIKPNWVDVNRFRYVDNKDPYIQKLDEKYGSGKHILHVGRKTSQKNIDTMIKALKFVDADCAFIGRGDVADYVKLAEKVGVLHKCHFIESVPNDELKYYYSWCDCMCTPSRWEGFGIVFIEAAACKCKIVTSDIAPMNEYLTNNINALLIKDFENENAIADAINRVIYSNEYMDMGNSARILAETFSQEKIDILEADIYESIISNGAMNDHCYDPRVYYRCYRKR